MRPLPAEPVAGMPAFVRGLSVIRGTPTPVVDLDALLGAPPTDAIARYVTMRIDGRRVALAVEEVLGLRAIDPSTLQDLPPLLRNAAADVIETVGTLDTHLLAALRATRILPAADGIPS